MKKLLLIIALGSISLLHATRFIKIINNTGATLHAKINFTQCPALERIIKRGDNEAQSTQEINTSNCCFGAVELSMVDGQYKGKTTKAYGERGRGELVSCKNTTFAVEIKDGELKWFRK